MRIGRITAFAIITLLLTSCEFKCQVGNLDKKDETSSPGKTVANNAGNTKTLNDIEIKSREMVVNRAFLASESGDLLPSGNTVALGEKINLVINIDSGWKETDGKTFIGATEIITTDNGAEILNSGDLFAAYNETGVDPSDAKVITLRARITKEPTIPVDHYLVTFRVWDKKGSGEITGRYKFHIK